MLKRTISSIKKQKQLLGLPLVMVPFLGGCVLKTYQQQNQPAIGTLFQSSASNGIETSYNLSNLEESDINATLSQQEHLNKLHSIAISVSQQFPEPGEGIPSLEGLQQLLKSQEGHCGHFVYLFARQLQELGYPYTIYGISSNINWNHALIEVTVEGEPFLFDPSNGIYYPYGFTELSKNPELAQHKIGTVSDNYKNYTLPEFFGDINRYYAFNDTNSYEHNVISDATIVSASVSVEDNGPENAIDDAIRSYYKAADQQPASIEIDLTQKEQIYRVSFTWLSVENYATDITIKSIVNGQATTILAAENQIPNGTVTNLMLKKPIEVEKLIFSFSDYQGDDSLGIREIKAFRY